GMFGDLGKTLEGSNKWPDSPSNFYSVVGEYINLLTGKLSVLFFYVRVDDLSRNILLGLALALGGCPEEFFEGEIVGNPFWVMRFIGYPAHTDYGLLALVNQDDEIPVLQQLLVSMKCVSNVRNQAGEWIWAVPIPVTFICNIGDMLKIWSDGLYESILHKVINNSPKYRVSVAFLYEPNFDDVIEP
ncbi:hypothetical protein MKX01_034334, partial [Papaver californicum]